MGVLWHKVLRDLWNNKGRTLLVVLIIGVGAGAIGMIIGTRYLMVSGMKDIWTSSKQPMINLFVSPVSAKVSGRQNDMQETIKILKDSY